MNTKTIAILTNNKTYVVSIITLFYLISLPISSFGGENRPHISGAVPKKAPIHISGTMAPSMRSGHIPGAKIPIPPLVETKAPKLVRNSQATKPVYGLPKTSKEAQSRVKKGWKMFQWKNGKHWIVIWNSDTGLPYKIISNKTAPYSGKILEVATQFLKENNDLFALPSDISNLFYKERKGIGEIEGIEPESITFYQTHQGIPVVDSRITIDVNPEGCVTNVLCTLYPFTLESKAPNEDKITQDKAGEIALRTFKKKYKTKVAVTTERKIYPGKKKVYRVWQVIIAGGREKHRYLVDSDKGKIIRRDKI